MSAFLAAVLSFPTVVFTVLLIFFLLYAIATFLGAADTEWLDGMLGVDDVNDSVLEAAMNWLGVAGIPVMVFGGISAVFAWFGSYIADRALPDSILIDSGIGVAAAVTGVMLGGVALRPLRPVFTTAPARRRNELVGKVCTIRSLRVDDQAGNAEVGDVIAEVRCFRPNELTLGSSAIVYDYDAESGIYHVGPLDPSITESSVVQTATTQSPQTYTTSS